MMERTSTRRAYLPWLGCPGRAQYGEALMPKFLPAALAIALLAGPALAQGTTSQTPPAAPSATSAKAPKADRTAKSKECSAEADQKGLHGKARKHFRSACKAGKA